MPVLPLNDAVFGSAAGSLGQSYGHAETGILVFNDDIAIASYALGNSLPFTLGYFAGTVNWCVMAGCVTTKQNLVNIPKLYLIQNLL